MDEEVVLAQYPVVSPKLQAPMPIDETFRPARAAGVSDAIDNYPEAYHP